MKRYTKEEIEKYCKLVDEIGYSQVHKLYKVGIVTLRLWKDPEYKLRCRTKTTNWIKNNPNYLKSWHKENKGYSTQKNKEWSLKNSELNKEMHQKHYLLMKNDPLRYQNNIKRNTKYRISRYRNDDEFRKNICKSVSKYQKHNSSKIKQYRKNKTKTDMNFRLLNNLRGRLSYAIKGTIKQESAKDLLGCSINDLKIYLAKKFQDGMNWDNYGKWHIDHIKPCAAYNMLNETDRKECFHYSNLQPLWAEDNFRKSDKYD